MSTPTSLAGGGSVGAEESETALEAEGEGQERMEGEAPPEVNEVLRSSRPAFASTNLLRRVGVPEAETAAGERLPDYRRRLEIARRQRLARLNEQAGVNLAELLRNDPPDDIQRSALLEMALLAQDDHQLTRAQQILAQYVARWPDDPSIPEVLLRQGLIFRRMGLSQSALSKFYTVMTSSLVVKADRLDYYQRVVAQAQAEIAETHYGEGRYPEAAAAFSRLLRTDATTLNRPEIHCRLIRCLSQLKRHAEVVQHAKEFLQRYSGQVEQAEVRFHLAATLKELGRGDESLAQVLELLRSQQPLAQTHPEILAYWQQRAGNEIANRLYQEGDYLKALEIYASLLLLDPRPEWQFPVLYQMGLTYERLHQPAKAAQAYGQVAQREGQLNTNSAPNLQNLLEMARWRQEVIGWRTGFERRQQDLKGIESPTPAGAETGSRGTLPLTEGEPGGAAGILEMAPAVTAASAAGAATSVLPLTEPADLAPSPGKGEAK